MREAFAYAFDRETYCTEVRSGDCTPTLTWIPPGIPGAIETDKFAFDPEAAMQALAESSYGGPENLPEIQLYYNSDRSGATERAEWVAGQYRDILGVELDPRADRRHDADRADARTTTTHPQLLLVGGWSQDYPDPQNWLSVYWTCDATFAQRVGYCNEEFDRLTKLGDTTVDPEERLELLRAGRPDPGRRSCRVHSSINLAGVFVVNPAVTGYTPTPSEVGVARPVLLADDASTRPSNQRRTDTMGRRHLARGRSISVIDVVAGPKPELRESSRA